MAGRQKLLSLWIWLLLVAALCPGAQHAYGKRHGSGDKGRGKGDDGGGNSPPSKSRGFPKQGLRWAGAAAAGMLGGTGTGFGLGFLGRPKHGPGGHHGHKTPSSEQDQRLHHNDRQGFHNRTPWRAFINAAAPAAARNSFLTLGHVVPFLTAAWIFNV